MTFLYHKISGPYISAVIVASTAEIRTSVILVLVTEKMVGIMFYKNLTISLKASMGRKYLGEWTG